MTNVMEINKTRQWRQGLFEKKIGYVFKVVIVMVTSEHRPERKKGESHKNSRETSPCGYGNEKETGLGEQRESEGRNRKCPQRGRGTQFVASVRLNERFTFFPHTY